MPQQNIPEPPGTLAQAIRAAYPDVYDTVDDTVLERAWRAKHGVANPADVAAGKPGASPNPAPAPDEESLMANRALMATLGGFGAAAAVPTGGMSMIPAALTALSAAAAGGTVGAGVARLAREHESEPLSTDLGVGALEGLAGANVGNAMVLGGKALAGAGRIMTPWGRRGLGAIGGSGLGSVVGGPAGGAIGSGVGAGLMEVTFNPRALPAAIQGVGHALQPQTAREALLNIFRRIGSAMPAPVATAGSQGMPTPAPAPGPTATPWSQAPTQQGPMAPGPTKPTGGPTVRREGPIGNPNLADEVLERTPIKTGYRVMPDMTGKPGMRHGADVTTPPGVTYHSPSPSPAQMPPMQDFKRMEYPPGTSASTPPQKFVEAMNEFQESQADPRVVEELRRRIALLLDQGVR